MNVKVSTHADLADTGRPQANTSHGLVPLLFDPIKTLSFQPDLIRDSWFLIGYVESDSGHKFNILVHQIINSRPGEPLELASILNVTDITNKSYRGEERVYGDADVTLERDRMHNVTPSSTISGTERLIKTTADFGWASVDFDVAFPGKILLNCGMGVFDFLGGLTGQYSIPWGKGGGSLVLDGVEHKLTGTFWFDRQWGFPKNLFGQHAKPPYALRAQSAQAEAPTADKWCWMDLNLSNGIVLGLWDIDIGDQHYAWVTALKPDGTHIIAAIEPLAEDWSDIWVSPESGQRYPTRYKVRVPALDCTLDVRTLLTEQEIVSGIEPKYEGVAEVAGTYAGQAVSGFTLIELMGDWRG
jgi:hypothetical protein